MSNQDYRSQLDHWQDLWDEFQKTDTQSPQEKIKPSPFGDKVSSNKAQDTYYDYLDSEEDLLHEEEIPNPIYPDSIGPDNQQPKPAWVSEDLLKEVESLKNKLFKLENKMARLGQGKKFSEKTHSMFDKSLYSEIKSIKSRLDKVSSKLGIGEHDAPWKFKD